MKRQRTQRRSRRKYRKRTQKVVLRYDFAFAGIYTVNQIGKVAPGLIKNANSEINSIAQQRINQIISQGGREIERLLPKILRRAAEDVYQTQLQKLKHKILNR